MAIAEPPAHVTTDKGVILCIFIYWGWDACLAVGEETKNPGKTRASRPSSPR